MGEVIATVEHNGRSFEVFNCGLCGPALLCPECGNNACNGGYGKDGQCEICPLTYDAQDAHGAFLAQLERSLAAQTTPGESPNDRG